MRKTTDTFVLLVNYGQGYEEETEEQTFKEIKERLKEYRENCPEYPCKYIKRRVPLNYWN